MITTTMALWGMARPLIMVSVVMVYVDSLLIARAEGYLLSWDAIIWGFVPLLLVSLSIHYTNEYADYETDALTEPTRYSGGSGVLPGGKVPRILALQAAWVTLLSGIVLAIIGLISNNINITAVVGLLIGGFGGWMYSLPPLKLAWIGWGELDNALLGGMGLHIYGYSSISGAVTLEIIAISIPFTLLAFNNLLATTWADKEADAKVGKNTLATKLTTAQLRRLYALVAISAFALFPILYGWALPIEIVAGSLLAVPMVIWGWLTYTKIHNPYPTSNAMVVLLLVYMAGWYIQ
jgi:1,4-dihydroxy-2-naphthoate polyprenyltransferase